MLQKTIWAPKELFSAFPPKGKHELSIFVSLFVFYFVSSLFFVFNTSIIDHQTVEADLYFSFDNPLILKIGRTQISGHPYIFVFYYPFVLLGNLLASLTAYKVKTLLFVFLSVSMVSLSNIYINRYLNRVIELPKRISLLLTIFFALFSTCLILSFTPESFTLSLFFLTFSVYYYSGYMKEKRNPPFAASILLTLCLGGVTVTNFAKGVLPVFFCEGSFKSKIKKAVILSTSFIAILCIVHVMSLIFLDKNLFYSMISHKDSFTLHTTSTAYFNQIVDHFLGAPIFFPELKNFFYYNVQGHWGLYDMKMTQELDYQYWWQYTFIAIIGFLIVVSLIMNYKNKFVQLVFLLLMIDVTIHCILGFGLAQPFIYGGHWVYCIPILMGWGVKHFAPRYLKLATFVLGALIVIMAINNGWRMIEFAKLSMALYPVQ